MLGSHIPTDYPATPRLQPEAIKKYVEIFIKHYVAGPKPAPLGYHLKRFPRYAGLNPTTCNVNEASRGAAAQSVTVKPSGCGFDPHSRR